MSWDTQQEIRGTASVVFGALLNGYPVNTVDPSSEVHGFVHMFGITLPRVVFCDDSCYQVVKKALVELKNPATIFVFDDETPEAHRSDWKSVDELL